MLKYAELFDRENHGRGILDHHKYLVGEMYGWDSKMRDKFFHTYRRVIIQNAKIRRHTKVILNKWRKLGYKVIIITARNSKYYSNPYQETYEWLKNHHVNFDELIVDSTDKKEICHNKMIDYFVDDMPNNCNMVNELPNIKVFIMDNGNNKGENEKIIRIKSLKDMDEVIENDEKY